MNNYSWIQQKLHQIALSHHLIRQATFDVESLFISSTNDNNEHVFVAGLARSGTTILLNSIYKSDIFASLSYEDMPFILAPNLWSKISHKKNNIDLVDRAHEDGIKVSVESPEAFEEVFWMTFSDLELESESKFKTYVKLINHKYNKKRYLSKNNQNIRRLELISKIFPNSKILIPYREPMQHAYSLLTQHKKFIEDSQEDHFISDYMKWIGHTEFGPNYRPIHKKNLDFKDNLDLNHWIEQWYLTYKYCFESMKNNKNVTFICYEKLCSSKNYWFHILKILKIEEVYDFDFNKSSKEICIDIDNKLKEKTTFLYSQLNGFDLE